MKFELVVCHIPEGVPWREVYDKPNLTTIEAAREWAEQTIENFNETLRPGETARKLLDVVHSSGKGTSSHAWKKTNLFTLGRSGSLYDSMRCDVCGITGKRYGFGEGVKRDSQFRSVGFNHCARSMEILARRRAQTFDSAQGRAL